MEVKELISILEKDFGWENLKAENENSWFVESLLKDTITAINYTRCCTELKSKECPMCNEEKDCEGHNVCEDCGGRSF